LEFLMGVEEIWKAQNSEIMAPLRLTDEQLRMVADAARHLRSSDRGRFLEHIAERLRALAEPGDGDVNTAVRAAMALMEAERARWLSP
jgi:hypothetical protein